MRFAACSLDIEVFAYILARDWEVFLETQQEMLLDVMEIVERAGATIALPSQVLHFVDGLTLEEVARHTKLSVSGVRKRLRKLRQKLTENDQ